MPFPHDLFTEIARTKKLTDLEIAVFLLLFGQDKNKVQIANELDIAETVIHYYYRSRKSKNASRKKQSRAIRYKSCLI